MKIFLAGCEVLHQFDACTSVNIKNVLISYYHVKKTEDFSKKIINRLEQIDNLICDSGLFTLMFGAGKGATHTLSSMKKYTVDYIKYAKTIDHKKVTFVESDVHKLLGMGAVFELRKMFEDSGLKVIYTWHIEEGIEGLYRLAEKYEYIAISVPELRVLFTGKKMRYQDGVKDLLKKIRTNVKSYPKIHLLGNTIQETMETNLAYSCDSTSYLSGVKYGNCVVYKDGKLSQAHIRSTEITERILKLENMLPGISKIIQDHSMKNKMWFKQVAISAHAYSQYQNYLDRNYKFIGG